MLWLYYSSLGKSSPQRDRVGPIRIEKKAFKSTPQTLRELQIKFKDLYKLFCFFCKWKNITEVLMLPSIVD